jgi:protein-tyrosine phosphatase
MSKITSNLYLGNFPGLYNHDWFRKHNIRIVIDLIDYGMQHNPNPQEKNHAIQYYHFPLKDVSGENLFKYYPQIDKILTDAENRGINVYVHCVVGMSRSPSIVIAYLMKRHKKPFKEVYEYVKNRRSIVRPNPGFVNQLLNWQKYLKIR